MGKVSHEIEYKIHGHDLQVIEVILDPGETVVAEPGAALFFDADIEFATMMGDGSRSAFNPVGTLLDAVARKAVGESVATTHFTNKAKGDIKRRAWFSAPYPGHVIPVDLHALGCNLFCAKEAFLCAAKGTQLTVGFQTNLGAAMFGGSGFLMQKVLGDGIVFIHGGGTIIERELEAGDELRAEPGSVLAFSETVQMSVSPAGGLKNMMLGGEGVVLAHLRGPGKVWIQSLPFSKLCETLYGNMEPMVKRDATQLIKTLARPKTEESNKSSEQPKSKL